MCCQLHTSVAFRRKETNYRLGGRQSLSGWLEKSLLPLPRFLLVVASGSNNNIGSNTKSHFLAYIFMSRFYWYFVYIVYCRTSPPPPKGRTIIFGQAYACNFVPIYRRLTALVDEICKWRTITFNWILLMVLLLSVWTFFFRLSTCKLHSVRCFLEARVSSFFKFTSKLHTSCNVQLHGKSITRFDIEHSDNDIVVLTFAWIFGETMEEHLKQDMHYPTRDSNQNTCRICLQHDSCTNTLRVESNLGADYSNSFLLSSVIQIFILNA